MNYYRVLLVATLASWQSIISTHTRIGFSSTCLLFTTEYYECSYVVAGQKRDTVFGRMINGEDALLPAIFAGISVMSER